MYGHILIVEDEAILYDRLAQALKKENFSVSEYTPSVLEAQAALNTKKPDIVLLDIHLKGKKTGIDLGLELYKDHDIPFIYVTKYEDTTTFFKGLETRHEQFIVKTKPTLNIQEVVRAIHTTLSRKRNALDAPTITKEGIMGLTNYLDNLNVAGRDRVSKVAVPFQNIIYFSKRQMPEEMLLKIQELNPSEKGLRVNYCWFKTRSNKNYLLTYSLKKLADLLPKQFARISDSYIVNLHPEVLEGRINGSRIVIDGEILDIKNTYKSAVQTKLDTFYIQ